MKRSHNRGLKILDTSRTCHDGPEMFPVLHPPHFHPPPTKNVHAIRVATSVEGLGTISKSYYHGNKASVGD